VPNLYPAFERQEVVVHSPRHVRTFADLTDEEIAGVARAWGDRREAAHREGFAYVHALVNEGLAAGSSLGHSHSQLVWLREVPPAVALERRDAVPELWLEREDLIVARVNHDRLLVNRAQGAAHGDERRGAIRCAVVGSGRARPARTSILRKKQTGERDKQTEETES